MLKRHEVEILLKAGHSKVEVARLTGVSLRSVNRIAEATVIADIWYGHGRVHFSLQAILYCMAAELIC